MNWILQLFLGDLLRRLNRLEAKMATIEEAVQAVKDTAALEKAQVEGRLSELAAEIQALRDQIANGGVVTDAQMAELKSAVENIFVPTPPAP